MVGPTERRAWEALGRVAAALEREQARGVQNDPELDRLFADIVERRRQQARRLGGLLGMQEQPAPIPERVQPAAHKPAEAARVQVIRRVSNELVIVRTSRPRGFSYRAGQSAKLTVGEISRRYSLASAPADPYLEFFIERRPGGAMSEQLEMLREGDAVGVGAVKGELALDPQARHHLMLATVTGVSPFLSLLRDHWQRGGGPLQAVLVHGASYAGEHGYAEQLEQLAAEHAQELLYLPTVSRPGEARNRGWQGAEGRVEALVEPLLERLGLSAADSCLYACGHPQMVSGIAERYRPRGFTVCTEPY